jgi:integrase
MGLYRRADSPYWWMWLEPAQRAEATQIRHSAPTVEQRKANRHLADLAYHRRLEELARGFLGLTPKPRIGFATFADWYYAHVVVTHASAARERSVLKGLKLWFRNTPLERIDRDAVLEWRTARLLSVQPSTVDRELDVLKSVLAAAVPKYLDASPITGLRRHRDTVQSKKRRPRILTADEELRILEHATDPEEHALIVLAIDTLMRLSDVTSLRRDRDYGSYLHVEKPKVEPYDVPVSVRLRKALDALPRRGEYYFPRRWSGRAGGLSKNTVWRIFRRLCDQAGVPVGRKNRGVTFHSLRHTGTTRMLESGANPIAVMETGGWKELRQLVRYGRATDESKRRAVESIAPTRGLRVVGNSKKR